MAFNMWDGPTSPPGKTLRKDIILDRFIKEQEEKVSTETLKTLLELKKAENPTNWTGEPKPIYDDGILTVFKIKKDDE